MMMFRLSTTRASRLSSACLAPSYQVRRQFDLASYMAPVEKRYNERRILNFPPSLIYKVVSDVEEYKHFVPWCIDSRVLAVKGSLMEAELVVGFHMLSERYTSNVTLDEGKRVVAIAKDTHLFQRLHNEWVIEPGPSVGSSSVSFKIEYAFRSMLHSQAASLFHDEVASKMVDAFVRRCQVLLHQGDKLQGAEGYAGGDRNLVDKDMRNGSGSILNDSAMSSRGNDMRRTAPTAFSLNAASLSTTAVSRSVSTEPSGANRLNVQQRRAGSSPSTPSPLRVVTATTAGSPMQAIKRRTTRPVLPLGPSIWS